MNTPATQQNGTTKAPVPHKPSRMTLASVVKGKQQQPLRVVLYGVEGIGKSTFGANAPAPIFLGSEDGTSQLDVTRFPQPETWQEMLDAVRLLGTDAHEYQTLVLDTLDWAEPMLWNFICKRDGMKSIEEYGFGKGYVAALDEWRVLLAALERARRAKSMHVVLVAHSWIRPFKNPEGEDFDRYEMKLHNKAAGLIKEWSDAVLFANFETMAHKDSKTKRVRGVSTGARFVYTERTAAYDAKNRHDLPPQLPLDWSEFFSAVQSHKPADPKALLEEIERKAKALGGPLEAAALEAIRRAGGDASKLAQLNVWCNSKLAEKEQ